MIAVFLGAGFSAVGGVPLASQIFARRPEVDRISRHRLTERVEAGWDDWHSRTKGSPEEFLAHLESHGTDGQWRDATWYVSLVIALSMGNIREVGYKRQPTVVKTNINRTTGIPSHERFWTTLFRQTEDVVVLTTNYDVLPERGLRNEPRRRLPRPAFNYGNGAETLKGSGYPTFTHLRPVRAAGHIPLLKLHGSVSWSFEGGHIVPHIDCGPAIQGKALIVAPVTEKSVPAYLKPVWDKAADGLARSDVWLVIGYSFPTYDVSINHLLFGNSKHHPRIHVFNPDAHVVGRIQTLLGHCEIFGHPGLPDGVYDLPSILRQS